MRDADPERAMLLGRYFKTGPGDYAAGDVFLGLRVPQIRAVAREFDFLTLGDIAVLLDRREHEVRFLALILLKKKYEMADRAEREKVYRLYLSKTARINNWDLVDVSAPSIVGAHLFERSRAPLLRLAGSRSLWERRIAVLATFYFIRRDDLGESMSIAERLVHDEHDLIHKAVGWMLREVAEHDRPLVETFLDRYAATMPRTMLRYALEKFPSRVRRRYLAMRSASSGA